MNARQLRKAQKAWLQRLIEEEIRYPNRDTLTGVRRHEEGFEIFTRERGFESGHRRFSNEKEAVAYLSRWLNPPV